MSLLHYQTLQEVTSEELMALRRVASEYNAQRNFEERIKLWRKDDILACLEPGEARWGFSKVYDGGREQLFQTLEQMSAAVPRLTWVVYDEEQRKEFVLRDGRVVI